MTTTSQPPSYDEYTAGQPPSGSALLEVEDGLTMNQRTRGRSAWTGLECFAEKLWAHLSALYVLWFISFVIACCAMSQANKNKAKIHSSSSSSSSSLSHYNHYASRCEMFPNLLYGDDVISFEGHHYQVIGGNWAKITWRTAEQDAWSRCYDGAPGYLATIESEEENAYLQSQLVYHHGYQVEDQAWIGATDMTTEGSFEWVDAWGVGDTFYGPGVTGHYENFQQGEPNENGSEDCVAFNQYGRWNDVNCYKQLQFFFVEFDA
ncbi:hypothetical protein CTAYLR_002379 [Chrysophaeum taylorii]|uniref:C-type lectin domain-containing protein n=1 Tax=Chrysophaeum taylorii TaxID=2483200 RepID=A0AAD7UGD0_9STRA|nr:hypothetical protein CTAYLR_002379 [Chrysophaeum taylorii]